MQYFVPDQKRLFDLHSHSDTLNALRALSEGKPEDVKWRDGRTLHRRRIRRVDDGTLKVTGIVRGSGFSAKSAGTHIPNFGDYQITKHQHLRHSKSGHNNGMEVEPSLLAEPDESSADSLVSTNDPDDMANEQTWPTEEEMNGGGKDITDSVIPEAKEGTTPKAVKRVPKGMSEYQASWIVEDDEEGDEDDETGDENGKEVVMDEDEPEEMGDLVADEEMETDTRKSVAFEDLDNEEEEKQLESWRNREREEEDDLNFPDEIDTPPVSSLHACDSSGIEACDRSEPVLWDPYENLPRDYARIFQFEVTSAPSVPYVGELSRRKGY
ncbi:ribosome biogenesis protein tsr1 [Paramarasmius palmivorus]|uniref:Ribosome biogenesis protein tsr1 n=1 Tax=Paramarasmius palmivorus TaxID=297713 RepID=A0AAW0CKI7_9AGAR